MPLISGAYRTRGLPHTGLRKDDSGVSQVKCLGRSNWSRDRKKVDFRDV